MLLDRAEQLGCGRPLYYAVSTACRLAGLEVSVALLAGVRRHAPAAPTRRLMAWLIEQTLAPSRLGLRRRAIAQWLLFIRSHWVRMPPGMLLRHLFHKTSQRGKAALSADELPG
jgi:hypothetical protein